MWLDFGKDVCDAAMESAEGLAASALAAHHASLRRPLQAFLNDLVIICDDLVLAKLRALCNVVGTVYHERHLSIKQRSQLSRLLNNNYKALSRPDEATQRQLQAAVDAAALPANFSLPAAVQEKGFATMLAIVLARLEAGTISAPLSYPEAEARGLSYTAVDTSLSKKKMAEAAAHFVICLMPPLYSSSGGVRTPLCASQCVVYRGDDAFLSGLSDDEDSDGGCDNEDGGEAERGKTEQEAGEWDEEGEDEDEDEKFFDAPGDAEEAD